MSEISAIPTDYNGRTYRSRLEADAAQLLDVLAIPFEYEARSYLLPSGIHYRPDFSLWDGTYLLETRGYESEAGARQLREFGAFVLAGQLGDRAMFGVLRKTSEHAGPVGSRYFRGAWGGSTRWSDEWWQFARCSECQRVVMSLRATMHGGDDLCLLCGEVSVEFTRLVEPSLAENGKLYSIDYLATKDEKFERSAIDVARRALSREARNDGT